MKKIKIAAVGDIAIMKKTEVTLFKPRDVDFDLFLANLEGPIVTTTGVPAEKPIRLRLPRESAAWLKDIGISAVSLANNHTLDWGTEGLYETLAELDKAGIPHTGAGSDATEAAAPVIFSAEGRKIAFLSWAATVPNGFQALKNRPGIAGIKVRTSYVVDADIDEQPGTPPWVFSEALEEDLCRMEASIRQASQEADFVILAMHWGVPPAECTLSQGPVAEYQAQIIDRAIEAGAGILLGHHCHTPLGIQISKGVPILYSLGNYIFHCDYLPGGLDISPSPVPYNYVPGDKDSCFTEIELCCDDDGSVHLRRVEIIPCTLDNCGEAREATQEAAGTIANRIFNFSMARNAEVSIVNNALVWESKKFTFQE